MQNILFAEIENGSNIQQPDIVEKNFVTTVQEVTVPDDGVVNFTPVMADEIQIILTSPRPGVSQYQLRLSIMACSEFTGKCKNGTVYLEFNRV